MKRNPIEWNRLVKISIIVITLSSGFTILYWNHPFIQTHWENQEVENSQHTVLENSTKYERSGVTRKSIQKAKSKLSRLNDVYVKGTHGEYSSSQRSSILPNSTMSTPNYCGVFYSESMDLLAKEPIQPLSEFKNPCWYQGKDFQCFPYFFLSGFPKCGTTDLYNRIKEHPQYALSAVKESHWLSKKRFYERSSLLDYLRRFYRTASNTILKRNGTSESNGSSLITGDSSATYVFDNDFWMILPGNRNLTEPLYTNPHYIFHLYPQAKIIISVRNPIERYQRLKGTGVRYNSRTRFNDNLNEMNPWLKTRQIIRDI